MLRGPLGRLVALLLPLLVLAAAATPAANAASDPAQYVNPFVGTRPGAADFGTGGGAGNTFPGPVVPFGMLQWSPDTTPSQPGGYFYDASTITGFSLRHLSGAGCGAYGDFPFMPYVGDLKTSPGSDWGAYSATFTHDHEQASPGYYGVRLHPGGLEAVPSSALTPAGGGAGEHGLRGEYYSNMTLSGSPAVTRTDPQVNFDWGTGSPASGVPRDRFSVRWTGTLTAPTTGTYELGLTSDDGSRLYLDGKLVIDNWGDHGAALKTASVDLVAGEPHDVRIDFYDNTVDAVAKFGWKPPSEDTSQVRAELSSGLRSGIGRFTYSPSDKATMLVNAARSENGSTGASVQVVGDDELTGTATSGHFCGSPGTYTMHFAAKFDRPFASHGTWDRDGLHPGARSGSGAYVTWDTRSDAVVRMRVAISFVSVENAERNLEADGGGFDLDAMRARARADWNRLLSRIDVGGGSEDQLQTFYTALYHVLVQPSTFSDVNGEYMGFDDRVHTARGRVQYDNFSGWDIYRSAIHLMALLAPHETSDMVSSLVADAREGGWLPKWGLANDYTGVMVGDPADPIIAGAYAFGARDFDTRAALDAMLKGATQTGSGQWGYVERPGIRSYVEKGYVPMGEPGVWGPAATTLEYNSADFAIARFAESIGEDATAAEFDRRAQGWQNLLNPLSGYVQPREADGTWTPGFDPASMDGFVEGNSAQYTWMVPFNVHGLFNAMGGDDAAVPRLDDFFTEFNAGPTEPYAFMGNEPSYESPWEYLYAHQPWKTQYQVRRAALALYAPGPGGLVGNDDLGATSGWFVWAALGLYPEVPGSPNLVIGSPLFPQATITLPSGGKLTIRAPGAAPDKPYVQRLSVDGRPYTKTWLPAKFIRSGGTLDFTLGSQPNKEWGSGDGDAPQSSAAGQAPAIGYADPTRVVVEPGGSAQVKIGARNVTDAPQTVSWSATPPDGVTLSPASGSVSPPPAGRDATTVTVRADAGAHEGSHVVQVQLTDGDQRLHDVALRVVVARPGSLVAYFDNAGISPDDDTSCANFDLVGWSYSEQALTAAGLAPGATVNEDGATLTWPDVPPCEPDNVIADGQTIDLPGAEAGATKLVVLGSATNGPSAGDARITYTDGTTQTARLGFSDWTLNGGGASGPSYGNHVVASMPYRNHQGTGRDDVRTYVFSASLQLDPGRTVQSVTLPGSVDRGQLHVFALGTAR